MLDYVVYRVVIGTPSGFGLAYDADMATPSLPQVPCYLLQRGDEQIVLHLASMGLACCALEFNAATLDLPAQIRRLDPAEVPPQALHVFVVAGTLTDAMAPDITAAYDALAEPKAVMSFGACSNSGGPYWDSYVVTQGLDRLMPVDVFVPGCPPRPEAFVDAAWTLAAQ